jgi:hypothetical protein
MACNKVKLIGLKGKNAYVRYLAAKGLSFGEYSSEEVNAVKELITNDSEPLVKYSLYETADFAAAWHGLPDPKVFFSLVHDARLAIVRNLTGAGEKIAAIIRYAVDNCLQNGTVTEKELFEILLDYINKKEFKVRYKEDHLSYDDPCGQVLDGKNIEALWDLVPKVPGPGAYVLILSLPASAGFSKDIPKKISGSLDNNQLEMLLQREDVELIDLRKKIFWEYVDAYKEEDDLEDDQDSSDMLSDMLVDAAISQNFTLTHEEFAKILTKPEKQKIKILEKLKSAEVTLPVNSQ